MSSPSGLEWGVEEFPSPARLNRKTIHVGTEAEIGAMFRYPGMVVFCTSGTTNMITNEMYKRDALDQSWIPVGLIRHYHDANTDIAGGSLNDILFRGSGNLFYIDCMNAVLGDFMSFTSGAPAVLDNNYGGFIDMITGAATNSTVSIRKPGVAMDSGNPARMITKVYSSSNTYETIKVGWIMERVDEANDTRAKFGYEMCDTINSARNWELTSSDGTIRSTTTTTSLANAGHAGMKIIHTPGVSEQLYRNGTLTTTKTSNVSITGGFRAETGFQCGVKSNSTASRFIRFYALIVIGMENDSNWE
jgi:hypothetical protein